MKHIIIIAILLSTSTFINAETNACINNAPNTECLIDQTELGYIVFYGELDIWITPSGAVIISCLPPFLERCYSLFWDITTPGQKTIILNDADQTEITAISGPVITTGENGEQIHTFTR